MLMCVHALCADVIARVDALMASSAHAMDTHGAAPDEPSGDDLCAPPFLHEDAVTEKIGTLACLRNAGSHSAESYCIVEVFDTAPEQLSVVRVPAQEVTDMGHDSMPFCTCFVYTLLLEESGR